MRMLTIALASACVLLGGCSGNDASERKAFVDFLNTRILDKPGLHVPQPTAEQRAAFGHYADDYAVITDFNKAMDGSVSPKLAAAMKDGSITSLEDIVEQQPKLNAAKAAMNAIGRSLGGEVAKADAAHGKLDQPAEVKVVFDKAYDRLVTQPAAAIKSVVPVMDVVLGQAADLGHYIGEHRSVVQLSGSTVRTNDPAVRSAINAKLRAMQASQQAVLAAQSRMQSVVYGTPS